jgi:hypothetical protein
MICWSRFIFVFVSDNIIGENMIGAKATSCVYRGTCTVVERIKSAKTDVQICYGRETSNPGTASYSPCRMGFGIAFGIQIRTVYAIEATRLKHDFSALHRVSDTSIL